MTSNFRLRKLGRKPVLSIVDDSDPAPDTAMEADAPADEARRGRKKRSKKGIKASSGGETARSNGKKKLKPKGKPAPRAKQDPAASGRLTQGGVTKPGLRQKIKKVGDAPNVANVAYVASSRRVTIKPQQTAVLANGKKIDFSGLKDEDGFRYIHAREGKYDVVTRYDSWHAGGSEASAALKRGGIVVVGGTGEVRAAVGQIERFPPAKIVSSPGWSRYGFALADGRVIVADAQPQPLVAFVATSGGLDQKGTLADWSERVAAPLADHLLASFLMMAVFAPALIWMTNRADNIGLELSGEAGRGKSTLQLLMASAAGPAVGDGETTYWRSLNTTLNALETVMEAFNDMPLILDEAGLVPGAGKADTRMAAMRELAFRLSAGQVKHRYGEKAGPRSRMLYVLSTNQSVTSLLGSAHAAEAGAIADRLITLPVLADRPHGIFDSCPPSYSSTGAFAEALKQAASENYGHALPAYLAYLVKEVARRPRKLRRRVDEYVAEFIKRSRANPNDGSQLRVAQALGLVYAGGRLAKEAGVLPKSYRCGHAAFLALELHRSHARAAVSFDDRLLVLMRHSDTIDLAKDEIASLDEEVRGRCLSFLYTDRSGARELLVPKKYINRVFPDWQALQNDPDVLSRLNPPKGRRVRDRPVGPAGKLVPVYRFDVTDLQP